MEDCSCKNHKSLNGLMAPSFEEMVVPIVKRRGRKRKGNSICSPTKKPLEEGGGRGGLDQLLQGAREAEVPRKDRFELHRVI